MFWLTALASDFGWRLWLEALGGGSGWRLWLKALAGGSGLRPWLETLARNSGSKLWLEALALAGYLGRRPEVPAVRIMGGWAKVPKPRDQGLGT